MSNKNCDLCLKDDDDEPSTATHHCTICKKNICDLHLQLHNRKKQFKNHIFISLLPNPNNNQPSTTPSTIIKEYTLVSNHIDHHHYCKDHSDQIMEIYCKDCNIIICVKCALFKHKLHNYIELTDIVNVEKENIKKLFNILNSKKNSISQRCNSIDLSIKNVKKNSELYEKNIHFNFINYNTELNKKKNELLTELENIRNHKLHSLQNEKEILNKIFNNLNKLCNFSSDNGINILQHKIKFENELNNLNNLNVLNLNEMNDINLNIENDKLNVIKLINLENNLQNNFNLIKFEEITKYGKQGNLNNELNYPNDIKFYKDLIYIADQNNKRIVILDNLLKYKNEIKCNIKPLSLELNKEYLYVGCSDSINNQINIYNLNNLQLLTEIKNNDNFKFNKIHGIATDKDNYLYICNYFEEEIIIFNNNYEFVRKFKTHNNLQPVRIIINNKDQIVVNDYKEIQVYNKLGHSISNNKFDNVLLNGIICDINDNYLICDRGNNSLLILDNNFNKIKEFKGKLDRPIRITYNETKNQIYVLDNGEHSVKLFK